MAKLTAVRLPSTLAPFGAYHAVALIGPDSPAYKGPATPHSLAKVVLPPSEKAELKALPALGSLLAKQGFGIVRSGSSLFQSEYEGNIYGGFPVYVTTDAAYSSWHLVFDKTLRDLEQQVLLPKLDTLVTRLVANAKKQDAALGRHGTCSGCLPGRAALRARRRRARPEGDARPARAEGEAARRRAQRHRDLADHRQLDRLLVLHPARPLHAEREPDEVLRRDVGARAGSVLPAGDDGV